MNTVVILQHQVPSYRIPFYKELIKLGEKANVRYLIFYGDGSLETKGRNDSLDLTGDPNFRHLKSFTISFLGRSMIFYRFPKTTEGLKVTVAEMGNRTSLLYKWAFFKRNYKYLLWGHGGTYTKSVTSFEKKLKIAIARRAVGVLVYTPGGAERLRHSGIQTERITTLFNSTDTKSLISFRDSLTVSEIDSFFLDIGCSSTNLCFYVGGIDQAKGIDFLLRSIEIIQMNIPSFQFVFCGDGFEKHKVINLEHKGIFYVGRVDQKQLAIISKRAKLLLIPQSVGLVAVDSFALQTPIVSTLTKFHGPEFEYLKHGYNSIITDFDEESYASSVIKIMNDYSFLNFLKENCRQDCAKYSIENMAFNFHQGTVRALI